MRHPSLFLVMIVLLLACQPAFGQEDDADSARKAGSDLTLKSGKYGPFLEVDYGNSTPKYEGLDQSFGTLGMLELKIGYASRDSLKHDLTFIDQHYGFVSFLNSDLGSSVGDDEIGSEMTRFGAGNRRGYGYGGSGLKIELYNQNGIDWTQLKPVEYESMSEEAQEVFDHFGTTYRFGQATEAGLQVRVTESMSLTGGYEGGVILPRHVFWPWLGSVAIYSGVQGALDIFSKNIIEASPGAGPVIAWLLKTGVSAGYYYLLKDDMNWPFGYEAPMTTESFKVGANFAF